MYIVDCIDSDSIFPRRFGVASDNRCCTHRLELVRSDIRLDVVDSMVIAMIAIRSFRNVDEAEEFMLPRPMKYYNR